jgi:radical SAM superfamily enzyme YgiQ (UPF0313 family)
MVRVALIELGPSRPELHEPIGIETIAGVVKRALPEVELELVSATFSSGWEERVLYGDFDVVGVAAKLGTWVRLKDFWRILRRNSSSKPLLVVGDLIGTYASKEVLADLPDALCVVGEGEGTMVKLLALINQLSIQSPTFRDDLHQVPNLAYLHEGRRVETHKESVDISLAGLPERKFLSSTLSRMAEVMIEGSRGCPWSHCSFCSIPGFNGASWRPFSLGIIMEQIEELSEAGARSVFFTDSDFLGGSLQRCLDFANLLLKAKANGRVHPDLNFYVNLQATGVIGGAGNSRDDCARMLVHLKEAGLREVFVGVESGAKQQVKRYVKASTPARNNNAVAVLHELGLESDLGFIMFDPNMVLEEVLLNLDFIAASGLWEHPSRFTKALRIQPGTGYVESFFGDSKPELNVNNLSFPYQFRDPAVDPVYRRFRQWELRHLDYETLVQGARMGEVSSEASRREVRIYLGQLRSLDLDFLRACAQAALNGSLDSFRLTDVEKRMRAEMLSKMKKRPAAVDIHAEMLGVSLNGDFWKNEAYRNRYLVLNSYEDPVYAEMDCLHGCHDPLNAEPPAREEKDDSESADRHYLGDSGEVYPTKKQRLGAERLSHGSK